MQFIKRGVPAVALVGEQFLPLAKLVLRSRDIPESAAVMIPGNPAYATGDDLRVLAVNALSEAVARITAGNLGSAVHTRR